MSGLRWLALEGALGSFTGAVVTAERTVTGSVPQKQALERGLALVDDVLSRAALQPSDIDALAVGTGPGSFTGLRIAVSYAKGLALALRRPLAGVSSYDVLADPELPPPVLAAALGRTGVICARLRTEAEFWVRCGTPDEVADMVAAHVAACELAAYGVVEGVAARLGERGFTVRAYPVPESPALTVARLAARRRLDVTAPGTPSMHDVRPDYGQLLAVQQRGDDA